jgi:hypothetical protein
VKDAAPLADNGYKVPLVRGILEETLSGLMDVERAILPAAAF